MQSPLPPSRHGILTYTGRVRDVDHDPEGIVRIESFQTDDVLVATPEPGTIGLFGLGLAGQAAVGPRGLLSSSGDQNASLR